MKYKLVNIDPLVRAHLGALNALGTLLGFEAQSSRYQIVESDEKLYKILPDGRRFIITENKGTVEAFKAYHILKNYLKCTVYPLYKQEK